MHKTACLPVCTSTVNYAIHVLCSLSVDFIFYLIVFFCIFLCVYCILYTLYCTLCTIYIIIIIINQFMVGYVFINGHHSSRQTVLFGINEFSACVRKIVLIK